MGGEHVEVWETGDDSGNLVVMIVFRGPSMDSSGEQTVQQVWDSATNGKAPVSGGGWTVGSASDGCYVLACCGLEAKEMLRHLAIAGAYKLQRV